LSFCFICQHYTYHNLLCICKTIAHLFHFQAAPATPASLFGGEDEDDNKAHEEEAKKVAVKADVTREKEKEKEKDASASLL
jgi:hypothetical protein